MSEPIQLPVPVIKYSPEEIAKLTTYLSTARSAAVEELSAIQKVETDEQYSEAMETLTIARDLYGRMSAKRKAFTDPIKEALTNIMVYENAINPDSKTENDYLRARKVLEVYNQKKVDANKKLEAEAYMRGETIKYKAEFKAKVSQQLEDMISGKERSVIDGMNAWESKLTLANIEASVEEIRKKQPTLKQEDYNNCFKRWGARPQFMHPEAEDEYLAELKVELTYEAYNSKFQEIVAPIKNRYLAKVDEIKKHLQQMEAADADKKEKMRLANDDRLKKEKEEELAKANKRAEEATQVVSDQKDMGIMEGSFTEQAMMNDADVGPSKKVFTFSDNAVWMSTLLKVISKVATSPKFKGKKANGELVPEIQKWLDHYSNLIGEPMPGLNVETVAKTIVKKEK